MKSNFRSIYRNPVFLFPYEHPLNEFPFYIDIELTNACNLECRMCNRRIMTRRQGFIAWEDYRKMIDEASGYEIGIRMVRYGEPFLHKGIIEMSRYAKDKSLLVFISTNGLLLDEELCKKIVDTRIDEIRFSVQGTGRAGYEKMRIGGDYDRCVSNIELLRKMWEKAGSELP